MYENEVRALRSDRVLHRISRDSEFRCVRKSLWLRLGCGYAVHRCETCFLSPAQVNGAVLLQQW